MGDPDGKDRNGDNRRLLTPLRHEQNTTNARPSRSRSPVSGRSQDSYRRRIQQRERELECERQRVLLLERELLREREENRRSGTERQSRLRSTERSERRGRRPSHERSASRSQRRSTERLSRIISEPRRDRKQPEPHRQRERRPSGERRALRNCISEPGRDREQPELHLQRERRPSGERRALRSRISEPGRDREQTEPRRQRERRPSGERRALRSRSPVFSSKDILSIIQSFNSGPPSQAVNHQGSQMSIKSLDYKNIIPEFDPSAKNQRIDVWLKKVNECASVYTWDEKTTVHFAMQKLRGLAKTWYESQNSILFTWPEWQEKLTSAFPCDQNYGQSLEEMLRRRSRFNEPIEVYFYEKLALLNNCEITGKRAVECIIHGISDKTTKSSALALRCNQPDVLLQFLMSNKESHAPQFTSFKNKVGNGTPGLLDNNLENNRPAFRPTSRTYSNLVYCFNCKEKGHPYLQCPKPMLKCDCCHKIGHVSGDCYLNEKSTNADTAKSTLCISNMNPNDKFYKNISVNGLSMEAFVDFGSEVTLIKESSLSLLNITHDGQPAAMKGFGNELVQSLGSVSLNLTVDDVDATVQYRVVKDHLLGRPLLVGQSFSEQPHVIVVKDATRLQFHNIGAEMPNHDPDVENDQFVRIRVKSHSVLHGIASVKAVSEAKFTGDVLLETKVIGKPNQQFVVCGGAYPVKDGVLNVIITPCNAPCLLQKNAIFSRGERVKVVNRIMTSPDVIGPSIGNSTADFDKQIDISQVRLGDSVTEAVKLKLIDLLQRYKHCFADDLSGLGCTDSTAMTIELNSQRPVVY